MPYILLEVVHGGGYVSIGKAIPPLVLLLLWARLMTWADEDAVAAHLPRTALNLGNLAGLATAYALFFLLPGFVLPMLALLGVFAVEAGAYLFVRNKEVGLKDLGDQWRKFVKGVKDVRPKKAAVADAVALTGMGGQPVNSPPPDDPMRPSFDALQLAFTEPLRRKAERIDLTPSGENVVVKYTVDGVGYTGPTLEGPASAGAVEMIKVFAGMDVEERRKPQTGAMKAAIGGVRRDLTVQSAGTREGEYVRLVVDPKKRHGFQLADLGMPDHQIQQVRGTIAVKQGLALLAAPRGQGLTSLQYAVLRAHDAFLTHIQTVERDPDQDLEGITQNKLAGTASQEEERKQVDWVVSQEPDVLLLNRIESPGSATDLVAYAAHGKKAYVGLRAASCAEAIDQWRRLVGDDQRAVEQLTLVVAGRVMRKLCMACKVPYAPEPAKLRQLGMNPDKVSQLFQAREEPLKDPKGRPLVCEFCQDLRFAGRIGAYEVLVVDDEVREALARDFAAGGKVGNQFKAVFRKKRGRYLQEEALSLVEAGETSVQEVLRVLRSDADDAKAAAAGGGGGGQPRAAAARKA